ncbi:hypothetical protein P7C70_g8732, partial [Phenoliferia sp. Uapishka_3]
MKHSFGPIRLNLLYLSLILLRLIIALTSTSTIHPDEHFQNPEVAASLSLDYDLAGDVPLLTWEWTATNPCRSIVPVWLTIAGPFKLAKWFSPSGLPSGRTLFFTQRLVMFVLSLCIGKSTPLHPSCPKRIHSSNPTPPRSITLGNLSFPHNSPLIRLKSLNIHIPPPSILKLNRNSPTRSHSPRFEQNGQEDHQEKNRSLGSVDCVGNLDEGYVLGVCESGGVGRWGICDGRDERDQGREVSPCEELDVFSYTSC